MTVAAEQRPVIDVYGSMLELDPGDSLYLGSHLYEPYESHLLMGLLREGDIAVDVGAMIGYYTVIFAKHVGATGRVHAFEPDPDNHALLRRNVEMNGYGHVTCHGVAVGAEGGRGQLWRAPTNRGDNHVFPTAGRDAVDIEIVALDDVIDGPVNLVKIDVQGYEAQVLAGMERLIASSPQLVMLVEFCPALLLEAGTQPLDLVTQLRDLRLALFEVDGDARAIRGVDAGDLLARVRPEFGDGAEGYTNLLAVRSGR